MPVINNLKTLFVRNEKGEFVPISAIQGRGIASIKRTSGDGSAGSTDVYTITYTDDTTSTFEVYNGKDGSGDSVTYTEQELTAEEQAQARENIDAAQKPLIVTLAGSGTDNNPYTCNATYSDIKAAYDDGRDVKMYYDVTLPIDGRVGEKGVYSGIADLWNVHEMMQLVYFKDESLQDLRCIELYINGLEGIVGGYVIYKFADQSRYGAVKADPAESTDTVPARIGDDGKLYVDALPSSTKIPANTSDLNNDSGFITNIVSDLANYYAKKDIDKMISTIPKFAIAVVDALPTSDISTTTVYFVGGGSGTDLYTEYIYVDGEWEILGSQRVDLTGYATETWVIGKLADYVPVTELQSAINTALAQAKESGEFDGEDGASVTITNTTESTEDGGENVVEFSDGNKMTVRNGKTGAQGDPGVYVGSEDTMPKGTIVRIDPEGEAMELVEVDDTLKLQGYAADAKVTGEKLSELSEAKADQSYVVDEIAVAKALISQSTPIYAKNLEWLEENGETEKVYLLPNGNLAVYTYREGSNYTNLADPTDANWKEGYRLSISAGGVGGEMNGHILKNYIPVTVGDVLRVKGLNIIDHSETDQSAYSKILLYASDKSYPCGLYGHIREQNADYASQVAVDSDGVYSLTIMMSNMGEQRANSDTAYILIDGTPVDGYDSGDIIITVNEEISETARWAWYDSGIPYANYVLTDDEKASIAQKVLDILEVSYIGIDNTINVGTYTLKYDDTENTETIGEVTT